MNSTVTSAPDCRKSEMRASWSARVLLPVEIVTLAIASPRVSARNSRAASAPGSNLAASVLRPLQLERAQRVLAEPGDRNRAHLHGRHRGGHG